MQEGPEREHGAAGNGSVIGSPVTWLGLTAAVHGLLMGERHETWVRLQFVFGPEAEPLDIEFAVEPSEQQAVAISRVLEAVWASLAFQRQLDPARFRFVIQSNGEALSRNRRAPGWHYRLVTIRVQPEEGAAGELVWPMAQTAPPPASTPQVLSSPARKPATEEGMTEEYGEEPDGQRQPWADPLLSEPGTTSIPVGPRPSDNGAVAAARGASVDSKETGPLDVSDARVTEHDYLTALEQAGNEAERVGEAKRVLWEGPLADVDQDPISLSEVRRAADLVNPRVMVIEEGLVSDPQMVAVWLDTYRQTHEILVDAMGEFNIGPEVTEEAIGPHVAIATKGTRTPAQAKERVAALAAAVLKGSEGNLDLLTMRPIPVPDPALAGEEVLAIIRQERPGAEVVMYVGLPSGKQALQAAGLGVREIAHVYAEPPVGGQGAVASLAQAMMVAFQGMAAPSHEALEAMVASFGGRKQNGAFVIPQPLIAIDHRSLERFEAYRRIVAAVSAAA